MSLCARSRGKRKCKSKCLLLSVKLKAEAASNAAEETTSDQSPSSAKLLPSNGDAIPADRPEAVVPKEDILRRESKPLQIYYREACQLSIPDEEIALLATANYTVYETIGANRRAMTPLKV